MVSGNYVVINVERCVVGTSTEKGYVCLRPSFGEEIQANHRAFASPFVFSGGVGELSRWKYNGWYNQPVCSHLIFANYKKAY
jgi:hypothetical protein